MAYESQRDRPFYETGYTTDDDAGQLRAEKLAKQKLPANYEPRHQGHVRDYGSDRDYDQRQTMAEFRSPHPEVDPVTKLAYHTARAEISDKLMKARIAEIAGDNETLAKALQRAYEDRRRGRQDTA